MPRVVPDQREKFDNDELFRKMSRESEVSVFIIDHNRYRLSISHSLPRCYCVGV